MGISMDYRLPNRDCSLSGSELNSPRCRVAIAGTVAVATSPSLTVSLAAIKLNCGIWLL